MADRQDVDFSRAETNLTRFTASFLMLTCLRGIQILNIVINSGVVFYC